MSETNEIFVLLLEEFQEFAGDGKIFDFYGEETTEPSLGAV